MMYYDKEGNPITQVQWTRLLEDREYSRIMVTELPNNVRVSTVWLGLDHGFTGHSKIIFETMVFGGKHDEYQRRYTTLEDAEQGHMEIVSNILLDEELDNN